MMSSADQTTRPRESDGPVDHDCGDREPNTHGQITKWRRQESVEII